MNSFISFLFSTTVESSEPGGQENPPALSSLSSSAETEVNTVAMTAAAAFSGDAQSQWSCLYGMQFG